MLILSDVGAATTAAEPGFDTDSKLFVPEDSGTAEGNTEVKLELGGPKSSLGNPVGITFDGNDLCVAEKIRDIVLRFNNVLDLMDARDRTPSGAVTVTAPESVALGPDFLSTGHRRVRG